MTIDNKNKTSLKYLADKYERIALVLQGGGALGSYQAGVYEGLLESEIEPTWIAGISIGALNTAIIAGNSAENRLEALKSFWDTICQTNNSHNYFNGLNLFNNWIDSMSIQGRKYLSGFEANRSILEGQNGFFSPRFPLPNPYFNINSPNEISYYKTDILKETLMKYADFDRINFNKNKLRVSVGAVNIKTGNFIYFDNHKIKLRPEHFMASGALPPGFPAIEIDGEFFWDGGLVSNTPLTEVLNGGKRENTLVFQIDLWSSKGRLPQNFFDVTERTKDIQYSSKTRMVTDVMAEHQKTRKIMQELLKCIPEEMKKNNSWCHKAELLAEDKIANIIQLIYKNKPYEGQYKDYEFSSTMMQEHWLAGLVDIKETLKNPNRLNYPTKEEGFITHDIHKNK